MAGASPNPVEVLWDKLIAPLPIYREQPDDPDHENTLATAVFRIRADEVDWQVYDRAQAEPRYTMKDAILYEQSMRA